MPVLSIRCSTCGEHFVDSRPNDVRDGDEVICPGCGARRALTDEFVESVAMEEPAGEPNVAHSQPASVTKIR